MNIENLATKIYNETKQWQLGNFRSRMSADKQGVEFSIGGRKFIAAIRRLTPLECSRLQTLPEDYEFVTSETQQYKGLGNGWNIETIKHCFSFLPDNIKSKPLTVLSLFDGISGGQMALRGIGCNIEKYIASEIDKYAIENTMHNFPDTIQIGSVTDINVDELVAKYGIPDMIIGGSPCQSFSFSGKMKGMSTKSGEEIFTLSRYLELKKQGFQFEGQSYLFWEYMRILTELRKYNPNIIFFLENVKMLEKWERCLSHAIGVRGVHINSALVSAQNRRRIYWTNIRTCPVLSDTLFYDADDPFALPPIASDIPQPADRGLVIKDVLQEEADEKYYLKDDTVSQLMAKTDPSKLRDYLLEPQASVNDIVAFMNSNPEYSSLSDEEKKDAALLAYKQEKERLCSEYHDESISNG